MKKIKIYRAKINEGGITALSLVSDPANKEQLVYLSNDKKVEIKLQSEEQRKVISPIIIPDQPIYRASLSNDEYDSYIIFTKEDVLTASKEYYKSGNNNSFTIEHDEKSYDIFLAESWIVDDTEKDKSSIYGFEVPVGTWIGSFDLESDELVEAVKEGKLDGISPELKTELSLLTELKEEQNNSIDEFISDLENLLNKKFGNK